MKTNVVTIQQAKSSLSNLIQKAIKGEEIVIVRGSQPVARLVAIGPAKGRRVPGSLKGELVIEKEFFETLPETELSGL